MPSTANTVSHITKPASNNDLARPKVIDDFISMYQLLNKDTLHLLKQVYSDDVVFQDPLHKVEGIEQLTSYFANLYANVDHIEFDIKDVSFNHEQASVFWEMQYSHPKLNKGDLISVEGMSQLKFSPSSHSQPKHLLQTDSDNAAAQQITSHRDYFDLGSMLYEQLPLLGRVIQIVKNKAST